METKTPKHRLPLLICRLDNIEQKLGFELNLMESSAVVGTEGYETRAATCHQLWIRFVEDALSKRVRENRFENLVLFRASSYSYPRGSRIDVQLKEKTRRG
jgi:hypothetical protein